MLRHTFIKSVCHVIILITVMVLRLLLALFSLIAFIDDCSIHASNQLIDYYHVYVIILTYKINF